MKDKLKELVSRKPELEPLLGEMEAAVECLLQAYRNGRKIMVCGNGGSAADAEHMVGELMKSFMLPRPLSGEELSNLCSQGVPQDFAEKLQHAIPAISLVSGVALPTAFGNDVDFETVFAQQVFGLGKPEDVLIAISTSGNSPNACNALLVAKGLGIKTIAFTGSRPSRMGNAADIVIKAPSESTPFIQEYHLPIYHAICAELEERLFGDMK